ncbi:LapA family protein [Streptomyces sp. H27-G5]|uniref:LapA family protein n=1 Tax=Streptomyces sp. H27-G5 TaxID=2996698 RepID=UPI002271C5DE|nr:LapA family protein [Streptomyces sp. H27-G5]MCY0922942.1 LapA family protein [Streptomyces sp. H27-G5]
MTRKGGTSHGPPTLTVKGRDLRLRTLGLLLLVALVIWFIAADTGSVTVRMWIPTVTIPLWAVLTVTLLAGIVLGLLHRPPPGQTLKRASPTGAPRRGSAATAFD